MAVLYEQVGKIPPIVKKLKLYEIILAALASNMRRFLLPFLIKFTTTWCIFPPLSKNFDTLGPTGSTCFSILNISLIIFKSSDAAADSVSLCTFDVGDNSSEWSGQERRAK